MSHIHPLARILDGPLLEILQDPEVTDVHINPGGTLCLNTHEGRRRHPAQISSTTLERALLWLAESRGLELAREPLFHTDLPQEEPFCGARLQAALPPLSPDLALSIRIHSPQLFNLDDLERLGTITRDERRCLEHAVSSHQNVLIVGGTSSGKTTLLNALLEIVATECPHDRLITLEDTFEIRSDSPDWVPLRAEPPRTLLDLVATALRMNPSRLVLGELRGPEALALIDAWNTGHRGGFATVHADSPEAGLRRLEGLIRRHPYCGALPLAPEIAAAVDLIVEIQIAGRRRVRRITELDAQLDSQGQYVLRTLFDGDFR